MFQVTFCSETTYNSFSMLKMSLKWLEEAPLLAQMCLRQEVLQKRDFSPT